jgi:hypothetical protein
MIIDVPTCPEPRMDVAKPGFCGSKSLVENMKKCQKTKKTPSNS